MLVEKLTPRDIYEKLYQKDAKKAGYEFSVNKYIKDTNGKN